MGHVQSQFGNCDLCVSTYENNEDHDANDQSDRYPSRKVWLEFGSNFNIPEHVMMILG